MPLSPKEIGKGRGIWPYLLRYSALIADGELESSFPLGDNATISFWWKPTAASIAPLNDMSGPFYHIEIRKSGSTAAILFNGVAYGSYSGVMGTYFHELIENILSAYAGSPAGYYAEMWVLDGISHTGASQFGEFSSQAPGLWMPIVPLLSPFSVCRDRSTESTVTASSNAGAGYLPALVLDRNINTYWSTALNNTTGSITFSFLPPMVIQKYRMTTGPNASTSPKSWTMQGSNDGIEWATIHTVSNAPTWGTYEEREYPVSNEIAFQHYRISVTQNQGSATYLQIAEIELDECSTGIFGPNGGHYDFSNATNLGQDVR